MRRFFFSLLLFLLFTILFIIFDRSVPVVFLMNNSQKAMSVPRALVYKIFRFDDVVRDTGDVEKNNTLLELENIKRENEALRSQFETALIPSENLIPAKVTGFLGEAHSPNTFIINQGEGNGVRRGMVVVYQDHLVGMVHEVTGEFSKVYLPNHHEFRILGKAVGKDAAGVIIGEGNEIQFENVVTTGDIVENDIVRTYKNQKTSDFTVPDDLVIGKLVDVQKDRSIPLKSGTIKSYLVFPNLHTVFVVK